MSKMDMDAFKRKLEEKKRDHGSSNRGGGPPTSGGTPNSGQHSRGGDTKRDDGGGGRDGRDRDNREDRGRDDRNRNRDRNRDGGRSDKKDHSGRERDRRRDEPKKGTLGRAMEAEQKAARQQLQVGDSPRSMEQVTTRRRFDKFCAKDGPLESTVDVPAWRMSLCWRLNQPLMYQLIYVGGTRCCVDCQGGSCVLRKQVGRSSLLGGRRRWEDLVQQEGYKLKKESRPGGAVRRMDHLISCRFCGRCVEWICAASANLLRTTVFP